MNPDMHQMAVRCYGYGSWAAPYWFIGPEQGIGKNEDLQKRITAWSDEGRRELSDCRTFHRAIGDLRWHGDAPKLQKTWKQLMLLLMAYRGENLNLHRSVDQTRLRNYQVHSWGKIDGETCVIELSGMPAYNYVTSKSQRKQLFAPGEFEKIRETRISVIQKRLQQHKPTLVVMYGSAESNNWAKIARAAEDLPARARPLLVCPTHPVSFEGVRNAYWEALGTHLREHHPFAEEPGRSDGTLMECCLAAVVATDHRHSKD